MPESTSQEKIIPVYIFIWWMSILLGFNNIHHSFLDFHNLMIHFLNKIEFSYQALICNVFNCIFTTIQFPIMGHRYLMNVTLLLHAKCLNRIQQKHLSGIDIKKKGIHSKGGIWEEVREVVIAQYRNFRHKIQDNIHNLLVNHRHITINKQLEVK